MPDLVLYQYQTCPYCAKVRRRLRQMGLPFEQVEVDGPSLLHRLGSRTVPVLHDGQHVLNESADICRYLEKKHGV